MVGLLLAMMSYWSVMLPVSGSVASGRSTKRRRQSFAASSRLTPPAKKRRRIALELKRERVPGPDGGAWGPTTINGNWARGTGILNNDSMSVGWSGIDCAM